jgi:hypothetical protein
LSGWGAKKTATVLSRFLHIENIPIDCKEWHVNVLHAGALSYTLKQEREKALLFRTLATLRSDIPSFNSVDELRWQGPTPNFAGMAARLDFAFKRIPISADKRSI